VIAPLDTRVSVYRAETPLNESLSEAEVKAKKFYSSCLDVNGTIESLGAQPLLDLVHKEFSEWSVSWDVGAWDFQDTLQKMHGLGVSSFFSFWVDVDEKEPTKNILKVNITSHSLLHFMFKNNKYLD